MEGGRGGGGTGARNEGRRVHSGSDARSAEIEKKAYCERKQNHTQTTSTTTAKKQPLAHHRHSLFEKRGDEGEGVACSVEPSKKKHGRLLKYYERQKKSCCVTLQTETDVNVSAASA
jgi:hypothetical protein